MRNRLVLAAALLTVACATAPASSPPGGSSGPAPSSSNERLLRDTGSDGSTIQAIERAFGQPHVRRRDGAGAALTYRLENCSLLLLFTNDSHNTLRLAEAYPSAVRAGEPAPSLAQCAASPRRD
ncbi:MAG: hypothetical protein ABW199_08385 [Caulobacterales bacterium]